VKPFYNKKKTLENRKYSILICNLLGGIRGPFVVGLSN
jgi:hypothetical protein